MKRWLGSIGAAVWLLDSGIILSSLLLDAGTWVPNTIIGLLFIAFAVFWWLRARTVNQMLAEVPSTSSARRFWSLETGLNGLVLFVAIIALMAIVARAFGEGKPIFG
jgi:hypothetical protein